MEPFVKTLDALDLVPGPVGVARVEGEFVAPDAFKS